jgi:MOSC domain-containing protein YiiM
VLEPGMLGAGDAMTLQARPNPNWSIARFHRLIAGLSAAPGDMAELTKLEGLAAHWREAAFRRTMDVSIGPPLASIT